MRELIRQMAAAHEQEIISGNFARDHVHVLLSYRPTQKVSQIMQWLKGTSSRSAFTLSPLFRGVWPPGRGHIQILTPEDLTMYTGITPCRRAQVRRIARRAFASRVSRLRCEGASLLLEGRHRIRTRGPRAGSAEAALSPGAAIADLVLQLWPGDVGHARPRQAIPLPSRRWPRRWVSWRSSAAEAQRRWGWTPAWRRSSPPL